MYINSGKVKNLVDRFKDKSYKDNYVGFLKEVRNVYSSMLGRSKTLTDVIIYNNRNNAKFDMRSKLLTEDIANLLINGITCDFGKYLLTEPSSTRTHTLTLDIPNNYKNFTNARFEYNYLINKIGLSGVITMLEALDSNIE